MMIYDFRDEFDDLSQSRRKSGFQTIFEELARDPERYADIIADFRDYAEEEGIGSDHMNKLFDKVCEDIEDEDSDLAWNLLSTAVTYEEEDYFGTEGLDV